MNAIYSPEILFEDNHLLVINKAPGDLVQGDRTGDRSLLESLKIFLKKRDQKPGNVFLGLPHRLDRPTSGVLVFAKTSKALTRVAAAFRQREVSKIYWAVVESIPPKPQGELKDWLRKSALKNISYSVPAGSKDAKEAQLSYRMLSKTSQGCLLEIILHTGRHHQIRAQLAGIGSAITGDCKYGAGVSRQKGRIYLHARQLELPHPTRVDPMLFIAPLPCDPLWDLVKQKITLNKR